jgi:flagellar basal-body rod protein FlgB
MRPANSALRDGARGVKKMAVSDIPILSLLRTKMHWHQERQRVLAENVANADMPQFKPSDLAPPNFDSSAPQGALAMLQTNPTHLGGFEPAAAQFEAQRQHDFEVVPSGNGVNLEDEMLKVASNQMDYQAATMLYTRGLGLIKTALGK